MKSAQLSIAIVCLIVGIMFAVQYKTTGFYKQSLVPKRIEDLSSQLSALAAERDAVETTVNSINQQLEDIRNSDKVMANMQKELQLINMAGGLYPAEGPGISITISDIAGTLKSEDSNKGSFSDVHDLLMVINELKASGAEAITINNQRVTAMSEIEWTGTMISVNGSRINSPFIIKAIGDPHKLEIGVSIKGGYLDQLKYSKQIEVKPVDNIKMSAFNGPSKMVYGEPVK